jgi:hypothetical protein
MDNIGKAPNISTEITEPTVAQFTAALANEYLTMHGARRLLAFVQLCQGRVQWSDKIRVGKINRGKLEYEISKLQKRKKHKTLFGAAEEHRLNELLVNVGPKLEKLSDEELNKVAQEWIDNIALVTGSKEPT